MNASIPWESEVGKVLDLLRESLGKKLVRVRSNRILAMRDMRTAPFARVGYLTQISANIALRVSQDFQISLL